MITTRELIERVQFGYSHGIPSDDARLSKRHVYSIALSARATMLTQKANKKQKLSQWSYQTLGCVELIKALPYECPCLPPVGCEVLRTKEPLPKPLNSIIQGLMIQSVTSVDGSVQYSETTWENKKYKAGNKYTSRKPDYYIRDNYLYITSSKGPKAIAITGVFNDPLEVDLFPSICEENCNEKDPNSDCFDCSNPLDKPFPIEDDLVGVIVKTVVEELTDLFLRQQEDVTNNAKDSVQRPQPRRDARQ